MATFAASRAPRSRPFGSALGVPEGAPLIGSIFRLYPEKRPLLWVRAAQLIGERLPEAHFAVFGSGSMERHFVREANRRGLGSRLRLMPPTQELSLALSALDVFVLTSQYEGTPNVVLEAALAGVPVVAMDAGAVAETVLDGRTGYVVPDRAAMSDDDRAASSPIAWWPSCAMPPGATRSPGPGRSSCARTTAWSACSRRRWRSMVSTMRDPRLSVKPHLLPATARESHHGATLLGDTCSRESCAGGSLRTNFSKQAPARRPRVGRVGAGHRKRRTRMRGHVSALSLSLLISSRRLRPAPKMRRAGASPNGGRMTRRAPQIILTRSSRSKRRSSSRPAKSTSWASRPTPRRPPIPRARST